MIVSGAWGILTNECEQSLFMNHTFTSLDTASPLELHSYERKVEAGELIASMIELRKETFRCTRSRSRIPLLGP